MKTSLLHILLVSMINSCYSAKLLAVLPYSGTSHSIFYSAILKILAERGHQVVEYSVNPPKKPIPNHTHVEIKTHHDMGQWTYEDFIKDLVQKYSKVFGLGEKVIWDFMYSTCDRTFKDENIIKLLQSNEHFDLIITAATFGQESMLVFGHKFAAPTITIQGFQYSASLLRESGNDLSIATIPDSMSFPFTDRMAFAERLQNFVCVSLTLFLYYYFHLPKQDSILKKHYPGAPSVAEMVGNVSLTLVNSYPPAEFQQPYPPNIIPVGGITTVPDRTQLPQEVQSFMGNAKNGVIYFSFGTVVPAHIIPKKILQIFVNVFKKLPHNVLWRINLDNVTGLSENVKLVKFVPQPGVLGHPNCAVFITHGGLFGLQEALQAGVPMIGIPFFADQPFNARFLEYKGIGVKLDLDSITEDSLHSALVSILNNPKYKENAKKMSRIFLERPMTAADSAVFWVEYVLRHGGGQHLRPAARQLAWYQVTLLDVLAVVVLTLLVAVIAVYFIITNTLSLVLGRKVGSSDSTSKKNI